MTCDCPGCELPAVWLLRLLDPVDPTHTVVVLCPRHSEQLVTVPR